MLSSAKLDASKEAVDLNRLFGVSAYNVAGYSDSDASRHAGIE